MLQVIISPAKKMLVRRDAFEPTGIPPFPGRAAELAARLRSMGRDELQALWRTSDALTDYSLELTRDLFPPRSAAELDEPAVAARTAPAAFSYDGIQYRSMAPQVMDAGALAWLQAHLWIVSGLYGCVRPFDAVMPYRLEMGTKLCMPAADGRHAARDLYAFWGDAIARAVCGLGGERAAGEKGLAAGGAVGAAPADGRHRACSDAGAGAELADGGAGDLEASAGEMAHAARGKARERDAGAARGRAGFAASGGPAALGGLAASSEAVGGLAVAGGPSAGSGPVTVVNLASAEYAKAVVPHLKRLPGSHACVACVFGEELRAGRPVQRATASKAARGSMVRWMAERGAETVDELRGFDVGYRLDEGLSAPDRLVFMRAQTGGPR